jgi:thiol-disulfide isomerase/thioredoxin
MKIFLSVFIGLLLLPIITFGQDFQLKAFVKGSPDLTVYLLELKGDNSNLIDSTKSENGVFSFTFGLKSHPGLYRAMLEPDKSSNFFDEDPKYFDFIFNQENIRMEMDFNDPLSTINVIESVENQIYYDFLSRREAFGQKYFSLLSVLDFYSGDDLFYTYLKEEIVRTGQEFYDFLLETSSDNPDLFVSKILSFSLTPVFDPSEGIDFNEFMQQNFFALSDFNVPELIYSNYITKKIIAYLGFFMNSAFTQNQQEDEIIVALEKMYDYVAVNEDVFNFVLEFLVDGFQRFSMEKVLVYLADNYIAGDCETDNEIILKERLAAFKKMEIGNKGSNIVLSDENNRIKRLYDLDTEYSLVLFWSTECPHCKKIIPQLFAWIQDQTNVSIFAVSIDKSKANWEEFLMMNDLPWINVYENNGWEGRGARNYNVYATPGMFLLDRDHRIVAKPVSFRELKKDFDILNQ